MTLVFLSYAYPPLKYPRSIQVSHLLRHLDRPVTVVCADEGAPGDATIATGPPEQITVARVPRGRLSMLTHKVGGRLFPNRQRQPDPMRSWALGPARRTLAGMGLGADDVLVTVGMPMSDHLVGLWFKRRIGGRWIAHFSDPWVDNPLHDLKAGARRANVALEREVVSAADRVVFVCPETADLVMRKYDPALADKARAIPHAFDPSCYPPRSRPAADGRIILRYIGNFYDARSPEPLFHALGHLAANAPALAAELVVELVGETPPAFLDNTAFRALPSGLVRLRPPVSYRESLALMVDADGLLVIDAPASFSVFLPSKLIDYIGAARPVFGISPPGASARVIGALGGESVDPADRGAVAEGFARFVEAARTQTARPWGDATVRAEFEATRVARSMSRLIDEVQAER